MNELKWRSTLVPDRWRAYAQLARVIKGGARRTTTEIELGSLSSAVVMPQDEWKRKRQKQPVRGSKQGRKHLLGPLKETPKSST